jgi:hypothetical protein
MKIIKGECGDCKHVDLYDIGEKAECKKCKSTENMWVVYPFAKLDTEGDLEDE